MLFCKLPVHTVVKVRSNLECNFIFLAVVLYAGVPEGKPICWLEKRNRT